MDGKRIQKGVSGQPRVYTEADKTQKKEEKTGTHKFSGKEITEKEGKLEGAETSGKPQGEVTTKTPLMERTVEVPESSEGLKSSRPASHLVMNMKDIAAGKTHIAGLEGVSIFDIQKNLEADENAILKEIGDLPEMERATALARLNELKEMATDAVKMQEDQYKTGFINEYIELTLNFRSEGLSDAFPKEMKVTDIVRGVVVDSNGKEFDDLRGDKAITHKLVKFFKEHGGDYEGVIGNWYKRQGGSSMNPVSMAVKVQTMSYREVAEKEYFFAAGRKNRGAIKFAKGKHRRTIGDLAMGPPKKTTEEAKEVFHKSVMMNMVVSKEFLKQCQMKGVDKKKETVTVYRTENKQTLTKAGITACSDEKEHTVKRSAVDSVSFFAPIVATAGGEVTEQEVAFHRFYGMFFFEGQAGSGKTGLLRDHEKEGLCNLHDVSFKYTKSI